jgi:hypothetical protein
MLLGLKGGTSQERLLSETAVKLRHTLPPTVIAGDCAALRGRKPEPVTVITVPEGPAEGCTAAIIGTPITERLTDD